MLAAETKKKKEQVKKPHPYEVEMNILVIGL